jgi:hypothetical protein
MKKARYSEERIVRILREAHQSPVAEVPELFNSVSNAN